jgi:hypothetical protein
MSDPAGELLTLEGAMRAPDAVMEPAAADVVARYIRAGGKPEDVIESLTSSYEGRRRTLGQGWTAPNSRWAARGAAGCC